MFSESCDSCPAGTIPATECTEGYLPACGCPETTESRDADVARPEPADAGGSGPADAGAGVPADASALFPAENCYEALGINCCGAAVGTPTECGCPPGTLSESECFDFALDADRAFIECRTHFGDGCCGEFVPADACRFECPAGSIPAETCGAVLGSGERPGGGAPPADPIAQCYEVGADGCCGEPVEINICTGECPAGSTFDCAFGGACGP